MSRRQSAAVLFAARGSGSLRQALARGGNGTAYGGLRHKQALTGFGKAAIIQYGEQGVDLG